MKFYHVESLSPLYEAVQSSRIFEDSKYFPDCKPLYSVAEILKRYQREHKKADFELKTFVIDNFELPASTADDFQSTHKDIGVHISHLWKSLTRNGSSDAGTLLGLPYPYIVPGGRFREIYYWDSYFTMLGLQVSGEFELIENMVKNFAALIDRVGHIPNGNRTYYLSRSQPPFFSMMVGLLAEIKGKETLLKYRPQLEKEYAFWMDGANDLTPENPSHRRTVRMPDGTILNRYWDDLDTPRPEAYLEDVHTASNAANPAEIYRHLRAAAESGWDFSSRWLKEPDQLSSIQTTDLVPVDLNCLLYNLEKTLLEIYRQLPDRVPADVMKEKARLRKQAIQRYFWNEGSGIYTDYHYKKQSQQVKRPTLVMVFPLYFNIATTDQAMRVAYFLDIPEADESPREFSLHPGGLTTTQRKTGQQWDAPNGWAPLQWMAYRGFKNYLLNDIANQTKNNWMRVCEKTFAETGKMMEKYNVVDLDATGGGGEYPNQDGFGWTNGVYLKMKMG
jgi:alpha,alpha-trehalase